MSERRFANEVAVITGGTRRIGLATAKRFAAGGAQTIVTYHSNEEAAAAAAATLDSYDVPTAVEQFDVSDFESVTAAFERITDEHGRPTVLVNNAGQMDNGLVVRMDPEQWSSVLDTNLTGAFYCTREAVRRMLRGEGGRISMSPALRGSAGGQGRQIMLRARPA